MKKIIALSMMVLVMLAMCACSTKVARGTTTDDAYINESLKLKFNKPTGWVFYTKEQISQQLGITADLLNDPELKDENISSYFEFMCVDMMRGDNVNMTIGRTTVSLDENIEAFKEEFKKLNQPGMTYTFSDEIADVKLGTNDYKRLTMTTTLQQKSFNQYMYVQKKGSFFITITATDVTGLGSLQFESFFITAE